MERSVVERLVMNQNEVIRLREENARLRAEVGRLARLPDGACYAEWQDLKARLRQSRDSEGGALTRVADLEAEVERLREALKQIDAEATCPAAEYVPALPRIWGIATAALRGGGE